MSGYISNVLSFLSDTWLVWLIFTIIVLAGYTLYWYLFGQRTYRAVEDKAQIRHGRLGIWLDLEEHLKSHIVNKEE